MYTGRFAPTPSGPLHLGSLLTALASYLQARAHKGRWLIRMDDLDRARCQAGADSKILSQLEAHGLQWDGVPRYQSMHLSEYRDALERLNAAGMTYRCICTRAKLSVSARQGPDGPVYAGTCRDSAHTVRHSSIRLRIPDRILILEDGWQGRLQRHLRKEIGDFVLRRADDVIAYQLACAIDEAAQSITEIVRGSDLLGSSFCQIAIRDLLDLPFVQYRHLPVLTGPDSRKLSKQNHAPALRDEDATHNLLRCLHYLGLPCSDGLESLAPEQVVQWAVQHWEPLRVPRQSSLQVE